MKPTDYNGSGATLRPRFDETYKRHAVELTLTMGPGRTVKTVAQELGLKPGLLYRWREQYAPRPAAGGATGGARTLAEAEAENRRLRTEVLRLRDRETVLKKSLGILSETPESGMPGSPR